MSEVELKYLTKIFFADLASGKEARTRTRKAKQAIVGVAQDWFNRFYCIYTWAGRETASEFRKRILDVYEKWQPRKFGLEANGMQVLFGSLVREAAVERFGDSVRISPIYQPTKVDKVYRIRTGLEPVINEGRLFIQEKEVELLAEIRGFPTAKSKDLVDALETAIRICPKIAEKEEGDNELEEYAKYLRNSGCPSHQIHDKIKQFEAERRFS